MKHAKETKTLKSNVIKRRRMAFLIIVAIIAILILAYIANEFIILGKNKTTNLIINNRNVTENLKKNILIQNGEIYLSKQDLGNFFDKYIYEDKETEQIITTYNKKIAEIGFEKNIITINGSEKSTYSHAINQDDTIYIPINELKDVYNIEINYIESTKNLVIDSLNKEQKKAVVSANSSIKSTKKFIAKTVARVKKGECVIIISNENGYAKIRTEDGKIGYIKSKKIDNEVTARQNMEQEKQITDKVNLVWDYYSQVASAPDRTDTQIDGVNVVSPSFFNIDKNGKLTENIGSRGQAYLEWARQNNRKIWPMVQNSGDSTMIDTTSKIMNSYTKRKELIESIINVCIKYKLDGINIDFENMRKEDKDLYSRFIIELEPRMKELGLVVSVDVTAPDGSDTWSLCFDRHVIGDVADYIIFMAYDQYGTSSNKSGTTAGYDWVNVSLNKFLKTEEIKNDKIILAIPLYTRLWTEDSSGNVVKQTTVSLKNIDKVIPSDVQKTWDDNLKQYYVEYQDGSYTKKMWIEDEKSLKEKISLIKNNNLAGVASWEKGMETDNFWTFLKESLDF